MKFDFIIGNPPYQEETESESTRMPPIYNHFMDAAYGLANVVELTHKITYHCLVCRRCFKIVIGLLGVLLLLEPVLKFILSLRFFSHIISALITPLLLNINGLIITSYSK